MANMAFPWCYPTGGPRRLRRLETAPNLVYSEPVERFNPEGIRRRDLKWVLSEARFVHEARRIDRCLLCKRPHVLEAGLCGICQALLEDPEELALVGRWATGGAP